MIRQRVQNEVSLPQRSMDSLARVLDHEASCIAISILEGKFVIASNDIVQGTGNSQADAIIEIFNFFKKIAEGVATQADFNEAFELSCSKTRFGRVNSVLSIADGLREKVIEQILKGDYSVHADLNKIHGATYHYVLAEFSKNHQDFLKLKTSIAEKT